MIPLNYIIRKYTKIYKFAKLIDIINHLIYMEDIKLIIKKEKEKELETCNTNNKNIQPVYRNTIWHRKIWHANNESGKRQTTEFIELLIQERITTLR